MRTAGRMNWEAGFGELAGFLSPLRGSRWVAIGSHVWRHGLLFVAASRLGIEGSVCLDVQCDWRFWGGWRAKPRSDLGAAWALVGWLVCRACCSVAGWLWPVGGKGGNCNRFGVGVEILDKPLA
jgi:hypothetical protein